MRRHDPDSLTPREREVLCLIRLGLTNEEIAGRLGITLDGAKYHVSQILSKLGVASREEAAAAALGERRRWWSRWWLWVKIGGAATIAAAAAGIALLAYGVISTPTEESVTVDVSGIPVEEAYARIRESVSRPGFVLHTTISPPTSGEESSAGASRRVLWRTEELWIDGARDALRLHHSFGWRFIIVGDSVYSLSPFDQSGQATKSPTGDTNPGFCPRSPDRIIGFLLCGGNEIAQPPDEGFTARLAPDEEYNGRPAFVLHFEQSRKLESLLFGPCGPALSPLTPAARPAVSLIPSEGRTVSRIYIDGSETLPMARVNEYFRGGDLCATQVYEYQNKFLSLDDLADDWLDPTSIRSSVKKAERQ